MEKEINHQFVTEGNLFPAILKLSVPIILSSFINTLYNLVDTYWLGRIGPDELAAITLVTPLQQMTTSFGAGITAAGAILLTQFIGAKEYKEAKKMLAQLAVYALGFSLLLAVLAVTFASPIIHWLGTNGEIFHLGKSYFSIVMMDLPFLIMIQIYGGVRQAQGDTRTPLFLNLLGVIINIILDPLFIVTFQWGVAGAAWATLGAKIPGALLAYWLLQDRKKEVHLDFADYQYDKETAQKIIQIGLPVASGGALMQFGYVLMTRSVWEYGSLSVAAYGIGNRINSLVTMPSNALGSATATIVGQNVGAGKWDRAEKGYKLTMGMAVGFLIIGGMILSRDRVAIAAVSVFTSDPEVTQLASQYLKILAIYCFANGVYNTTVGIFSATGHTVITMAVDASRLWVFRFGTLYLFQSILNWGVESIWYSVVWSNALAAGTMYIFYLLGLWKKNKVSKHSKVTP